MWKEVIELRQDPRIFGIIFIAPVVQLTVLGYAATTDVRHVPIVIVDSDRSAESQQLISRFTGSGIFELVDVVSSVRDVDRHLETRGRVDGAVDTEPGTAKALLPAVRPPSRCWPTARTRARPISRWGMRQI